MKNQINEMCLKTIKMEFENFQMSKFQYQYTVEQSYDKVMMSRRIDCSLGIKTILNGSWFSVFGWTQDCASAAPFIQTRPLICATFSSFFKGIHFKN